MLTQYVCNQQPYFNSLQNYGSLQYNDYRDSLQHVDAVMLEFHGGSIVL